MAALPSRTDLAGAPTNATFRAGIGALWDYLSGLFGTDGTAATARQTMGVPLRGALGGLTLSTAGSSATFSVAAGEAADSGNAVLMTLAAALAKTTSAWAVGNAVGGLDTGAIAANTWYHVHLIRRPDTGVVDALVSLSATAPTLPTNYTQSRRIGSMKTDGSSQWTSFIQTGDAFRWAAPTSEFNASSSGTAAVLRTVLGVPSGLQIFAYLTVTITPGSGTECAYISDPAATDLPASFSDAPRLTGESGYTISVRTNTSAQIRTRQLSGTAADFLRVGCYGWDDLRGQYS